MKKIKNQSGFSLAETMLATLILLLVSVLLFSGVSVAKNIYGRIVSAGNAQLLLSTAAQALRDELGTARDIRIGTTDPNNGERKYTDPTPEKNTIQGDCITYYSADTGAKSEIYIGVSEGKETIWLEEYANTDDLSALNINMPNDRDQARLLVTNRTASDELYVKYGPDGETPAITYHRKTGVIEFNGLSVYAKNGDEPMASLGKGSSILKVRVFLADRDQVKVEPAGGGD